MAWTSSGMQWGMPDDETSSLRHYFLYRGLFGTAKAFENELKQDKEKAFRVDKIMEQILHYITTYDIVGLKDYWNFLETKIFSAVDVALSENVPKLQRGLLRYYVIYAQQQGKNEKVVEFFDKMSADLSSNVDWKEWFMMPFLKNPDSYNSFEMYFNKQWQDSLMLSLHNFLCLVLSNMKKPEVLGFQEDRRKIEFLEIENTVLKQRIDELTEKLSNNANRETRNSTSGDWIGSTSFETTSNKNIEFLDDFNEINSKKEEASLPHAVSSSAPCPSLPLVTFIKNFTTTTTNAATTTAAKKNSQPNFKSELSNEETVANEVQKSPSGVRRGQVMSESNEGENNERTVASCRQTSEQRNIDSNIQADLKSCDYAILSQEAYTDHSTSVVTCRFNSTGKSVVSLDSDGILKIWTCHPFLKTMSGTMSKSVLTTIEWMPASDRYLLLGSKVGDIRYFDARDRKVIKEAHVDSNFPKLSTISVHPDGMSFVTSSHGRVASLSSGRLNQFRMGLLSLWDLNSDIKLKRHLPISPCPVAINSTTYNQSGSLLLAGGCDGRIRLYDIRTSHPVADWPAHDTDINTVSFASDSSNNCFSFAADGSLIQWSLDRPGCKLSQFNVNDNNNTGRHPPISGGGRSFVLNPTNSHALVGWGNTLDIFRINTKFDPRTSLNLGQSSNLTTCIDWLEQKSLNICLSGTQKGVVMVTTLEVKPS